MTRQDPFVDSQLPVVNLQGLKESDFNRDFLEGLEESKRLLVKDGLRSHGYVIFRGMLPDVEKKYEAANKAALEFFSSSEKSTCVAGSTRIEGLPGWGKHSMNKEHRTMTGFFRYWLFLPCS